MELTDIHDSLAKRVTFSFFRDRFSDRATALETRVDAFKTALRNARSGSDTGLAKALSELAGKVDELRGSLNNFGNLTKHGWEMKEGVSESGFKDALKKYKDANDALERFLNGGKHRVTYTTTKEVTTPARGNKKATTQTTTSETTKEVEVSTDLKNAYLDAKKAVTEAQGVMNSFLGHARVNGLWSVEGLKKTAQHNLNELKFWDKSVKVKPTALAFRGGALVLAGSGIADAVLRSKDAEGENRSMVVRGGELLAAVGAGTLGVLGGKAI